MENNTTEIKQNYLRNEILDAGYDGDDFSEYIDSNYNEKGLNVENWTFEELKDCVEKYKKSKLENNPELNNNNNENNIIQEENNMNFKENNSEENEKKLENIETIDDKKPEQKIQNKMFDFFEKNKNIDDNQKKEDETQNDNNNLENKVNENKENPKVNKDFVIIEKKKEEEEKHYYIKTIKQNHNEFTDMNDIEIKIYK